MLPDARQSARLGYGHYRYPLSLSPYARKRPIYVGALGLTGFTWSVRLTVCNRAYSALASAVKAAPIVVMVHGSQKSANVTCPTISIS